MALEELFDDEDRTTFFSTVPVSSHRSTCKTKNVGSIILNGESATARLTTKNAQ